MVAVESLSRVQLLVTPWTAARQASLSFTVSRVYSNSRPLSWWCYLTISSSATPFSFCRQSFPTSGSFLMSWLFTSGGLSIRASASASVLPLNIQGWFPLRWKYLKKTKNRTTIWSSNPTPGYFSIENKNTKLEKMYVLPCLCACSHSVVSDSLQSHGL